MKEQESEWVDISSMNISREIPKKSIEKRKKNNEKINKKELPYFENVELCLFKWKCLQLLLFYLSFSFTIIFLLGMCTFSHHSFSIIFCRIIFFFFLFFGFFYHFFFQLCVSVFCLIFCVFFSFFSFPVESRYRIKLPRSLNGPLKSATQVFITSQQIV